METTAELFFDRPARDFMSHEVVTIPQHLSLREAARVLSRAQISGAPVVDGQGKCVGVLSASDFVRWADKHGGKTLASTLFCREHHSVPVDWQVVESEDLPTEPVRDHMTKDVVTIGPDASIREVARMMLDAHIHRLIVIDEKHRPVGIISSMNIVAAVAYGADHS